MAGTDRGSGGGADMDVSNQISGGIFFHAVIQGRDITVQLPPQIAPALSGMPPASAAFTGRDKNIDELLEVLGPRAGEQQAVLVTAVSGLAGVGKTELVVQTAARALERPGWFPGGVLFTDMFGYDPERRLSPERALDGMLRALGMPAEHIPGEVQDRCRLYRSVLADFARRGRRILVVIDNVSTAGQARPLLPTDGVTAALLTSRHTLDVDARLHDLDVLTEQGSVDLLRRALLHARGPGDVRVRDAPEQAVAIARLCGGLPLALHIAAALLAETPTRPLASLEQALKAAHTRLDRLRGEDRAVRAAFDLSYQRLSGDHARLFRLLPLHAGPDLCTESAARLLGTGEYETEELLQDLARAHLVEPGHVWGRWRLHDLVRLYADERGGACAQADQRPAAQDHLHDHYRTSAEAADAHLRTPPSATSHRFADRREALAWLDGERLNLVTTVIAPPPLGRPSTSKALAFALARYLDERRHFDDLIAVSTCVLAISRRLGDRAAEGSASNNLGTSLRRVRRFGESIDASTRAVAVFHELGDRHGEAQALANLGNALFEVRRFNESVDTGTRAAAVLHELGDRHGEAGALNNLGLALRETRRFDEALAAHTEAAAISHELGDRRGEGVSLNNLGSALGVVRRFDEAIGAHTRAAAVLQELGDRHGEGATLNNLGGALREARRFEEAVTAHSRAAAVFHELGDRHGEAQALNNLANALGAVRRFDEAIATHLRAGSLFHELGDRHGEGLSLSNLGTALDDVRRFGEAIDAHTRAVAVSAELGDHRGKAMALTNLGGVLRKVRRFEEATDAVSEALAGFRESGDRHAEAKALSVLGAMLAETGRFGEAIEVLTGTVAVFHELGDRHGEAEALTLLGVVLRAVRRFGQAVTVTGRAVTLFRELGDHRGEAMALDVLAHAERRVPGEGPLRSWLVRALLRIPRGSRHRTG